MATISAAYGLSHRGDWLKSVPGTMLRSFAKSGKDGWLETCVLLPVGEQETGRGGVRRVVARFSGLMYTPDST
jgi:hypothetical protein